MRGVGSLFEEWLRMRQQPHVQAQEASSGRVREMTTDDLKAMWDSAWPPGDVKDGIYIEDVHAELNRRGEGRYCAV